MGENAAGPRTASSAKVLELLGSGALETADKHATRLIARMPEDVSAQYALGLVRLMQGRAADSVVWLEKAQRQMPGNALYQCNLGVAYLRAGNRQEAIAHLGNALVLQPRYKEAQYNLGCAYLENDQAADAFDCFSRLMEQYPDEANYICAAGDAVREMRNWAKAASLYKKAIDLNPATARAHTNLAPILMHTGYIDEAITHCRTAMELDPAQISAYKTLGDCLVRQEAFEDAMNAYADAYEIDAHSAILNAAIGSLWYETSEYIEAATWFQQALQIDESNVMAQCGLARIVRENGQLEKASELLRDVLAKNPDSPDALIAMADTLWDDGDAEGALEHLRRAQAIQPERISLHAKIGHILSSSGDIEQAIREHSIALEKNPACTPSLSGLAITQRGKLEARHAETMEKLLGHNRLRSGALATLHNGLAFYHDGLKNHALAAEHARLANINHWDNRTKRGWKYDVAVHEEHISALMEVFDQDYFREIEGLGSADETPVFIVAMPRSGTTLTEQILARHPRVLGIGERNFMGNSFNAYMSDVQGPGKPDYSRARRISKEVIANITTDYLAKLHALRVKAGAGEAIRIVDKLPDNYALVGWILTLFPNAKIIHCRRDPRDVALSCWMTQFASIRWACQPEHLVERIKQYLRIMDHWRKVLPGRFMEFDYEDLVADQEAESRRLIAWIGLDWDASCLSFYESDRLIRTASITQVRQPIYKRSVAKWKSYEPYMRDIFDPLTRELEDRAGRGL